MPRTMFVRYKQGGDVLGDAKGQVSSKGLKVSGRSGDIVFIDFTKEQGTNPIKYYANELLDALGKNLSLIEIAEDSFVKYLRSEGAKKDHWNLRFWDVDRKRETSKAITVGKEIPELWSEIQKPLRATRRGTTWAGAEFTHPKLNVRLTMYRWPTSAIVSFGRGSAEYDKVKEGFVRFLRSVS